jgi:hypothetical protein
LDEEVLMKKKHSLLHRLLHVGTLIPRLGNLGPNRGLSLPPGGSDFNRTGGTVAVRRERRKFLQKWTRSREIFLSFL